MSRSTADWAERYIAKYQLALVPIPPGHKAPLHPGWNQRRGYVTDIGEAQQRWGELPDHGIGAVLSPSGLCSLDADTPEHAEPVLGELGIALGALRKAVPTVIGNPSHYRLMFKAPPGVALGRKVLAWPARQTNGKPVTLFELRAGDIQDVLPPTIHPGTGKPYVWQPAPNSQFPFLPEALFELWQHWDSYRRELEAMCPWAKHGFNPEPAPRGDGARPNVIAAFNRAHSVEDLLKEHGYTPKGKRWLSPTSSSGLAGVVILDGKAFFHHASDPLADGHTHDAFDLYRLLDHGGDTRSAVKAAAEDLGLGSTASAKVPGGDKPRPDNGLSPGQSPGATAGATGAPTFITAAALWDMQHAPTRWAVPGILPEGVTILGGKPKTGKSWLALDLAIAVGTGGRALGAIEVEPGPVLYLALEDTKRRLTKRLRILCGDTIPPPEQIEFLTDCPRLGSGGEEVLRAWLRDHPTARFIVIDTLPRFRPPTKVKETPYANDYAVGEYLSRLCVEFQVSILLLGHLRKQPGDDPIDEISGTLGLVGSVDGYMVLRRQAMSDGATLYVCGRDVDEPAEHCIAWNRDRARWTITGGDPRVSRLPPEQRRVYELLSEGPKSIKDLTEELHAGHVVTDPRGDPKYKNAAKLVYKLRDRELVFQRPFDKRWAPSTGKREREQGVQGEQGAQREQGEHRTGNVPPVPPCSPSGKTREGEHESSNDAGSRGCSPVPLVPPRNPAIPDRATEDPGGHVGGDGPAPAAGLTDDPPTDGSTPFYEAFRRKAEAEPGYSKDAAPRYCCVCAHRAADKRCLAWQELGAPEGWKPIDKALRRCRGFLPQYASLPSRTCPRCDGEGCAHCGGMGRLVDDQPEETRP